MLWISLLLMRAPQLPELYAPFHEVFGEAVELGVHKAHGGWGWWGVHVPGGQGVALGMGNGDWVHMGITICSGLLQ